MAASYPTSVKTFTTKSTADIVQAAHVNDLQDEVNAIEAGLLNGTAPLNSSNSTVANLSVTGNSTLTGAVTFSSLVTFSGQPRAQAYASSGQAINASSWTKVNFNVEEIDIGGLHSTATNPSRFTIPTGSSGDYLIAAAVYFSTGGEDRLDLLKNNAATIGTQSGANFGSTSLAVALHVMTLANLNGGDYVEARAWAAAAVTVGSTDRINANQFTILRMG